MPRMIDGSDLPSGMVALKLGALPAKDRLNQIFIDRDLVGARLDLTSGLIAQYDADITCMADVLERNRLRKAGWVIDCHLLSQDSFYAAADGENRNYVVLLAMGVIPLLFSVAAELEVIKDQNDPYNIKAAYASGNSSLKSWFPWLTDVKHASASAIQVAQDAALLLYFHEIAHVLFGHCSYEPKNSNEMRALELDADFNAGTMFALWLRYLKGDHRCPKDADATIDRLIRAGFLLGVVLKALSAKSSSYHAPTVRTELFFAGATYGIDKTGGAANLAEDALQKFWLSRKENIVSPLQEALRNSSLRYFAGTESEIERDIDEMANVTYPLYNNLKDHQLKAVRIPL